MQALFFADFLRIACQEQLHQCLTLPFVQQFALGQELGNDAALLGILQAGDSCLLAVDCRAIRRSGKNMPNEHFAMCPYVAPIGRQIIQEGMFDFLPCPALLRV